jgi:hypothetical protein
MLSRFEHGNLKQLCYCRFTKTEAARQIELIIKMYASDLPRQVSADN